MAETDLKLVAWMLANIGAIGFGVSGITGTNIVTDTLGLSGGIAEAAFILIAIAGVASVIETVGGS